MNDDEEKLIHEEALNLLKVFIIILIFIIGAFVNAFTNSLPIFIGVSSGFLVILLSVMTLQWNPKNTESEKRDDSGNSSPKIGPL